MHKVYILQSQLHNKYYIGHTKNLNERFKKHNKGLVRSTKSGRPWKVIHAEEYKSKQDAYRRELQIKSYKGGEAFKKLIS